MAEAPAPRQAHSRAPSHYFVTSVRDQRTSGVAAPGTTGLAQRTQRTQTLVSSSRRASRDRTWRDPQIQTAHRSPPFVFADLSTSVWPTGGRPWRTHDRVRTLRPPRTPREIVTLRAAPATHYISGSDKVVNHNPGLVESVNRPVSNRIAGDHQRGRPGSARGPSLVTVLFGPRVNSGCSWAGPAPEP